MVRVISKFYEDIDGIEPFILKGQTPGEIDVSHEYCLDAESNVIPDGNLPDSSEYTTKF